MAHRSRADQELVAAAGKIARDLTREVVDAQSRSTDLWGEVLRLRARLRDLDWSPIGESNLPQVGDETLDEDGQVDRVVEADSGTTAKEWIATGFLYRRPINAPGTTAKT